MNVRRFLTLILFAGLVVSGCSNKKESPKNIQLESDSASVQKSGTMEMTLEMFNERIMDIKDNPKEWSYKGTRPAIIDFYATWCGPCKMTAPILDSLALEYEGKIDIYKVDVDAQRELAALFGIESIPSLLFIPVKGQPQMQTGAMGKADIEKIIKEKLLKE